MLVHSVLPDALCADGETEDPADQVIIRVPGRRSQESSLSIQSDITCQRPRKWVPGSVAVVVGARGG